MSTPVRHAIALVGLATAILATASCSKALASSPAPTSTSSPSAMDMIIPPPTGRVVSTGMVIDTAGEVRLCLDAIMESYPPQCDGIPVDGWSWSGLNGYDMAAESRWGSFAVFGEFNGARLLITDEPVTLALYDSAPQESGDIPTGQTSESELERIHDELKRIELPHQSSVFVVDGHVRVTVAWDDGSLQRALDDRYGKDVVIVTSALRTAE